jgi:hypothetical protein
VINAKLLNVKRQHLVSLPSIWLVNQLQVGL